jgi:hypothetical protein
MPLRIHDRFHSGKDADDSGNVTRAVNGKWSESMGLS